MSDPVPKYAALLRGINVGGNRTVKMADVKKAFETLEFRGVKSIGASGNILFASNSKTCSAIAKTIDSGLRRILGMECSAIVRPVDELRKLIKSDPFRSVKMTPDIRLYVTFLTEPVKSRNGISIPYKATKNIFQILKLTNTEIFTVVDLAAGGGTLDAMAFIEKEFGKNLTIRNWNTVKKLAQD